MAYSMISPSPQITDYATGIAFSTISNTPRSECKTLIICKSVHQQNTAKLARAFATVMHAEILTPEEAPYAMVDEYDLIGIGSGIYFGRFHTAILDWVRQLPDAHSRCRRVFLFSTSGLSFLWHLWHRPLRAVLEKKGFNVVAEFHCRGFDTFGPLWLIGGINRRHPDDRDLAEAADFAQMTLI